jgi:periplasmic protein TonB
MFNELLESSKEKQGTNTSWSVVLSAAFQVMVLSVLVLIPLIYTQALPKAMLATLLVAPPPPPPPPPPVKVETKPVARLMEAGKLMQPRAIPKEVAVFKEAELPPDVPATNSNPSGVFGGIPGQGLMAGNAPVMPPPPRPATPVRIKQGGSVTAASLISQTKPAYPPLARQARIQGVVVLHAIISKEGQVSQLEVISGHPLLVQSALDAVKQWRYKPTQLNGEPAEVDTTIQVTFTMGS